MNIDPQLKDPDNLDFRLEEGSPAKGYGCETNYIPDVKQIQQEKIYYELTGDRLELKGHISKNTLIKADSVSVTDNIIVENGTTLNISAGTVMSFEGPFSIIVEGTLIAEGTAEQRIIFTSSEPDQVDNYIDNKNSWNGIKFDKTLSTNDSSSIKYAVFEYAKKISYSEWEISGYYGGALYINSFSKITIENNIFRYNSAFYGAAIGIISCEPQINNNLFYENYAKSNASAASFLYSYPTFYNNTVVDNYISEFDGAYRECAVFCFRSRVNMVNNIIRDSPAGVSPQVHYNKEYFTYNNNIQGIDRFNDNIDRDPSFDLDQLLPGVISDTSICIDKGADRELIQPEFDLLGNPRIMNSKVDMGAFENQSVSSIVNIPASSKLLCIYPNPGNPSTIISFTAQNEGSADIYIYDLKGIMTEKIKFSNVVKGINNYLLKFESYSSGLYFINVRMNDSVMSGKFLLLK